MRQILHRTLWSLVAVVALLACWGGYYVCNKGFSRHWRLRVTHEFRRRGLDLYVRRLTLDPIQGLVARDVTIDDAAGGVLATVDRVALDINLTNLLHRRPFLDAVDLRNANLSVPLDTSGEESERLRVSNLNARIMFPPNAWYVSEAEATVSGVRVSVRGRLLNPEAFHPGGPGGVRNGAGERPREALDFLQDLETVRYGGDGARVEVTFGGDAEEPKSLYADATLWAERVRRGGGELKQVYAAVALREGVVTLKQCNVTDSRGELDASGSWDLESGRWGIEMRSTLGVRDAARLLKHGEAVQEWEFAAPPEIELSGSGRAGAKPEWLLTGRAILGRFAVKGTQFAGAGTEFSWDWGRWYVRDGWIANETGVARVRALSEPGSFRGQVESDINPNSLQPLASGQVAAGMRDWDFQASPKASLTITGTGPDPGCWETQGHVELGRTLMRNVALNRGTADVEVKGLTFTYHNFVVERDEGKATGTFAYDFAKHEAWMTHVESHLNTAEAAVWIDPDLARQLAPYRFHSAPAVTLDGFVQCATGQGTHLEVNVEAPDGLDYTFCRRVLDFTHLSGQVVLGDHRLTLRGIDGRLCGGRVQGGADITFGRNAQGYTADLEVGDMDFASITKLYFNYDTSKGLLNGRFDFGGRNDDPWTLYGTGNVHVTDGNVFAIPVLGPFSGILNAIVPGMGYNLAHDGSCTFGVKDGVISTRDFLVKGLGFSMIGDGRLMFLDDRLNFHIRLNMQGLPGVLLFPVSKLLEYAGTGTLEAPNWKPVLLEGKR